MSKRVSATQARVHFGEILRAVQEHGETIVVEHGGRAAAIIAPIAAHESAQDATQARHWRARVEALHGLWESQLGKRRLPDAVEEIRKGREERDARLDELLRR